MFTSDSDINYICNIIDGMEALMLGDTSSESSYNRAMVMGVLENNGMTTTIVEGNEGFVDWIKQACETAYKSIKSFFKSIWDTLFGSKESNKEVEKKISEVGSKASKIQINSIKRVVSKDEISAVHTSFQEKQKQFEDALKDPALKQALGGNQVATIEKLMQSAGTALAKVESNWEEMPAGSKWMNSRSTDVREINRVIDLAESEWHQVDKSIDSIKLLMNGVSESSSEEDKKERKNKLNALKNYFRAAGQMLAMLMKHAKRAKSKVEEDVNGVHKQVLALEHKAD